MTSPTSAADLSRREFLQLVGAGAAAAAAACTRHPYRASDFVVPGRSPVALLAAADYRANFTRLITDGLSALAIDVRGRRVLLKPNLVEYAPGAAINTHPAVIAGAAEACLQAGAREVVVGEAPGHRRDVEYLLSATGLREYLGDMRLRFVDLNHDDVRRVPACSRFAGWQHVWLPEAVLRADVVVSMPKLKTHHWAGMTAGMKNLFGVVPGAVYGWPKNVLHQQGIDNSIVDLAATVRPQLVIVDGVIAMEGDGPIMGVPRALGLVAIGTDPVAVDATCARVIGLDPRKLPYLNMAGKFLGNLRPDRIDQRGELPARFASTFDVVPPLRHLRLSA